MQSMQVVKGVMFNWFEDQAMGNEEKEQYMEEYKGILSSGMGRPLWNFLHSYIYDMRKSDDIYSDLYHYEIPPYLRDKI